MAQVAQLYVAGKYTEGSGITSAPVISPVNGEHLADLPVPLPTELDDAVAAARRRSRSTGTGASTSGPNSATASPT